MKITKKEQVLKDIEVVEGVICDNCKNFIENMSLYFAVFSGHNKWGSDSHESYKHHDICSLDCLTNHMNNFYDKEGMDYESFYEIEVNHYMKKC